jgi:hypothetical protein
MNKEIPWKAAANYCSYIINMKCGEKGRWGDGETKQKRRSKRMEVWSGVCGVCGI